MRSKKRNSSYLILIFIQNINFKSRRKSRTNTDINFRTIFVTSVSNQGINRERIDMDISCCLSKVSSDLIINIISIKKEKQDHQYLFIVIKKRKQPFGSNDLKQYIHVISEEKFDILAKEV